MPDERPQWSGLTLIMVCRNVQKAEAARGRMLSYLDRILKARRATEYGQNFSQNLVIEIEKCDFTSVKSVVDCARRMRTKSVFLSHLSFFITQATLTDFFFAFRYPYLNHLVLNAGSASFAAIDWFKLTGLLVLHPIVTLTVVSYVIQHIGEKSEDGLGYIWQCNIFGPYLFVGLSLLSSLYQSLNTTHSFPSFSALQYRELQPLLEAFHSRSDVDYHYPSRVLWTTSLEATHFYRPDDWQLVETDHSYEASKYQTDLVASHLENQALQLEEQTNRPAKVRHFLVHPGCVSTGIAENMLHPILVYLMGAALYLVSSFFTRLEWVTPKHFSSPRFAFWVHPTTQAIPVQPESRPRIPS